MTERPHSRQITAELREIAADGNFDYATLHAIYVELRFRKRRAARELLKKLEGRLAKLKRDFFKWPSTDASPGAGDVDESFFYYRQGLLGFMGYCVGASGSSPEKRRELLSSIYEGPLPSLNSREYMATWGKPKNCTRLRKMAESIAAFARNAKRHDLRRFKTAVADWESDLAYLKRRFYVGHCDFKWPDTETQPGVPADGPRAARSARR
jgi:hypothetical protein